MKRQIQAIEIQNENQVMMTKVYTKIKQTVRNSKRHHLVEKEINRSFLVIDSQQKLFTAVFH